MATHGGRRLCIRPRSWVVEDIEARRSRACLRIDRRRVSSGCYWRASAEPATRGLSRGVKSRPGVLVLFAVNLAHPEQIHSKIGGVGRIPTRPPPRRRAPEGRELRLPPTACQKLRPGRYHAAGASWKRRGSTLIEGAAKSDPRPEASLLTRRDGLPACGVAPFPEDIYVLRPVVSAPSAADVRRGSGGSSRLCPLALR